MDVIPLDAGLVRGSHGRVDQPAQEQPILMADEAWIGSDDDCLPVTAVQSIMLRALDLASA